MKLLPTTGGKDSDDGFVMSRPDGSDVQNPVYNLDKLARPAIDSIASHKINHNIIDSICQEL